MHREQHPSGVFHIDDLFKGRLKVGRAEEIVVQRALQREDASCV